MVIGKAQSVVYFKALLGGSYLAVFALMVLFGTSIRPLFVLCKSLHESHLSLP
jgi:1,4-dihydroxy-2-naphthoate octaprenyltransferase